MANPMIRPCLRDYHARDEESGLELKLEAGKEYHTTAEPTEDGYVRVFTRVWGWVPVNVFGEGRLMFPNGSVSGR